MKRTGKVAAILLAGLLMFGSVSVKADAVTLNRGNTIAAGKTGEIVNMEENKVPLAVLSDNTQTHRFPWGEVTAGVLMLCIVAEGIWAVLKKTEKSQG